MREYTFSQLRALIQCDPANYSAMAAASGSCPVAKMLAALPDLPPPLQTQLLQARLPPPA